MAFNCILLVLLISSFTAFVHGHGRLLQPPSRSSMWRYKYTDPLLIPYKDIIQENYDDNGLNCGGKQTQIDNNGMCGVCGDSYTAQVKENEAGGKYALGIITRHLLSFESGETKWYLPEDPSEAQGTHVLNIRLPSDVTCDQCLLQWRYRTGNSWGYENGQQGLGLGQQEEFYGCADIGVSDGSQSLSISPDITSSTLTTRSPTPTTSSAMAITAINVQPSSTRIQPSSTSVQPSFTSIQPSSTSVQAPGGHASTHGLDHQVSTTGANNGQNRYPRIDCGEEAIGLPIYRDCHSFYICAYLQFDPFVFACPPGTVCNPNNGKCDHPYNVPPPCNTA